MPEPFSIFTGEKPYQRAPICVKYFASVKPGIMYGTTTASGSRAFDLALDDVEHRRLDRLGHDRRRRLHDLELDVGAEHRAQLAQQIVVGLAGQRAAVDLELGDAGDHVRLVAGAHDGRRRGVAEQRREAARDRRAGHQPRDAREQLRPREQLDERLDQRGLARAQRVEEVGRRTSSDAPAARAVPSARERFAELGHDAVVARHRAVPGLAGDPRA